MENDLKVLFEKNDVIKDYDEFVRVYNTISEKGSWLGSDFLDTITNYFNGEKDIETTLTILVYDYIRLMEEYTRETIIEYN